MKRKTLGLLALLFVVICAAVLLISGREYLCSVRVRPGTDRVEDCSILLEQEGEVVRLTEKQLKDDILLLRLRSVSRGAAYLEVRDPEGEVLYLDKLYVHPLGILTCNSYLGYCAGAWIVPVLVTVYLALLLCSVLISYRKGMKDSLYQYQNIRNLGWILFLALMLVGQIPYLFSGGSLVSAARQTLNSASTSSVLVFPLAFVVSILVAVSNLRLIRKEGRNWRNLLGLMLGLLVCLGTVAPLVLSEYLQRSTLVDVHNERGAALYVEMAVTNGVLVIVSYLECILWGTVILSVKAARRIPAFDKDYLLILGCQIRQDGSLTPLLKDRADRALEFARLQEQAAGRKLCFVPSGGQGPDECCPEAEAIAAYLRSQGVPEDRILSEEASRNTYENFACSMERIRADGRGSAEKIAFATTNYHVFRSGILAREQGIPAEGIGSRTHSYFWINAFVREFIATVYAEWKKHLQVIAALVLLVLILVLLVLLSNIL